MLCLLLLLLLLKCGEKKGEFRMLKCKGHSEHFNIILISLNQTSLIPVFKQIMLKQFIDKRSE